MALTRRLPTEVGMDPRNLPRLCGYHLDQTRMNYRLALRDSDERVDTVLRSPSGFRSSCVYCKALRVKRTIGGGTEFLVAPAPDHVHEWIREKQDFLALGFHSDLGERFCSMRYACASCHSRISSEEVFLPDSFLHDCERCGKHYHDASPFSRWCSWDCVENEVIQMLQRAAMSPKATAELQKNAHERLESLSSNKRYAKTLRHRAAIVVSALEAPSTSVDGASSV